MLSFLIVEDWPAYLKDDKPVPVYVNEESKETVEDGAARLSSVRRVNEQLKTASKEKYNPNR